MNVDKFGHHVNKKQKLNELPCFECGWKPTSDGNLSAQFKILKNIQTPVDSHDSVTKEYVDKSKAECSKIYYDINKFTRDLSDRLVKLESQFESLKQKYDKSGHSKRNP